MTIILEESIRKWKRAAEHRQVRIKGPDSDREIYQEGDRNALVEVFDNLVENAAKFANDGSVITVEILEPDDRMAPPWLLSGPGRRFVVRNQGPGVAPDEQEEIFKPFVQGRIPLSSRVIRGTGVGLAICREIVTAHEGTIKAQSRPSSGIDHRTSLDDLQNCIFEVLVDLPIKLAHAEAAAPTGGT
jgi:signal transduction histidine kinase